LLGSPDPERAETLRGNSSTLRTANLRRGIAPRPCNNGSGDPMELDLAVDEIFKIFRQPP
jgi:hypothetical protein